MIAEKSLCYLISLKVVLCRCDPLKLEYHTFVDTKFVAKLMYM
jgi:hypothetical protein